MTVYATPISQSDRELFLSELRSGRTLNEAALSCAYFGTREFQALCEADSDYAALVRSAYAEGLARGC